MKVPARGVRAAFCATLFAILVAAIPVADAADSARVLVRVQVDADLPQTGEAPNGLTGSVDKAIAGKLAPPPQALTAPLLRAALELGDPTSELKARLVALQPALVAALASKGLGKLADLEARNRGETPARILVRIERKKRWLQTEKDSLTEILNRPDSHYAIDSDPIYTHQRHQDDIQRAQESVNDTQEKIERLRTELSAFGLSKEQLAKAKSDASLLGAYLDTKKGLSQLGELNSVFAEDLPKDETKLGFYGKNVAFRDFHSFIQIEPYVSWAPGLAHSILKAPPANRWGLKLKDDPGVGFYILRSIKPCPKQTTELTLAALHLPATKYPLLNSIFTDGKWGQKYCFDRAAYDKAFGRNRMEYAWALYTGMMPGIWSSPFSDIRKVHSAMPNRSREGDKLDEELRKFAADATERFLGARDAGTTPHAARKLNKAGQLPLETHG